MPSPNSPCVRADLHCHSMASNEADEALLNAINCPESYSEPVEVYDQAKRRGMNFVTITDHDSIAASFPCCRGPMCSSAKKSPAIFPKTVARFIFSYGD